MSTTKNTIKITAAVLALVASLALTGCSSTGSTATVTPAAVTTSSTPVTPPVVTAPAIVSGAVLTTAQLAKLPDGVRAYPMADGTKVAVVKGEALAPAVQVAVTAATKASVPNGVPAGTAPLAVRTAANTALTGALTTAGIALGRQVIAVYPIHGRRYMNSEAVSWFWTTTVTRGEFFDTAEQAQAAIASQIAANPTGNVVVVLSN